ncbi:MAG: hypothetical protein JWL84_4316 [Rhodospirillales bacterium]|jgi:uncharacterized SAM-binding protein YcdF (DUF218 family)|nr:hypothetical protein [Rhodospirillales bacterium]
MAAQDKRNADVIVVLGCAVRGDIASPALVRRMDCAIALFHRGVAPRLLLSGGGGRQRAEAAAMRDLALAGGVPAEAILTESASHNTNENAAFTARLMRDHGFSSLVLVSEAYHLPRARLLFRAAGLAIASMAHPPRRSLTREWPLWLREGVALAVSLMRLLRAGLRRS